MANEINVTTVLSYTNAAQNIPLTTLQAYQVAFNIAGKNFSMLTEVVPTTAGGTAIPISNLSSLGFAIFINRDPTNYVQLLSAVSGTVFARINPGETALLRFDPAITAPAWLAHTTSVLVQALILEN